MEVFYFSINQALEYSGGHWHIFKKLQECFIREYSNFQNVLSKCEECGDYNKIRLMIHSLKGISKNLGATKLYEASVIAEDNIQNSVKNPLKDYLDVFEKTYKEIEAFSTNL